MDKLIDAVWQHMGYKGRDDQDFLADMHNVTIDGADGGFSGFVYYEHTQKFTQENIREIMGLVRDMADDCGIDETGLIAKFRCLKDSGITARDIDLWRDDESDDDTTAIIENALAWFALESVAGYIEDGGLDTDDDE